MRSNKGGLVGGGRVGESGGPFERKSIQKITKSMKNYNFLNFTGNFAILQPISNVCGKFGKNLVNFRTMHFLGDGGAEPPKLPNLFKR